MSSVRDVAQKFWVELSESERWELGDQLVLGTLDWMEWMMYRPPAGFWEHVDYLRMLWEAGE